MRGSISLNSSFEEEEITCNRAGEVLEVEDTGSKNMSKVVCTGLFFSS